MHIIESNEQIKELRNQIKSKGLSIGFVPTMGALHQGHLELVRRAKNENDTVFVSIFVNPTQFNDPKDLEKYPRTLEKDSELLSKAGCDYLFYPTTQTIYPDSYKYKITENEFSKILCGQHRPGHFDGVLTVVMKLFNLVSPHRAYFGEKDYQQLQLIKGMSEAFFLDLQIINCPTVRESDGLAMSSRNQRLSTDQRALAPELYKILSSAGSDKEATELLVRRGFKVDYVETHSGRRFAAAFLGDVRLIDNVVVRQ